MSNINFKLSEEFGTILGPRHYGVQAKEKVIKLIHEENPEKCTFDLTGVELLTSGFSRELFGTLYLQFRDRFKTMFEFKFDKNVEREKNFKAQIILGIDSATKL